MFDGLLVDLTTPVVAGTLLSIVAVNIVIRSRSFKRDAVDNSFGNLVTGSISLLSNKDSVLKREQVKNSISGYENLFNGARKEVGSLQREDSIKTREKEYKTMVNSFYDLVTDFYEWGWGQVRRHFSSAIFFLRGSRTFLRDHVFCSCSPATVTVEHPGRESQ